jgi:hypothetical protein
MLKTRLGFWSTKEIVAFQICLVQLFACIEVGRTVLQHDMASSKATKKISELFLKLGFDMFFLGFLQ